MADGRERILLAAQSLFAGSGFHAVSVSDIADAADVTKGAITHHFKSKRGLWQEVCDGLILDHAEDVRLRLTQIRQGQTDDDPVRMLTNLIVAPFESLLERPEMNRILVWSTVEQSRELESSVANASAEAMMFELIGSRLEIAQGNGLLDESVDPYFLTTMFYAQFSGWLTLRQNLAKVSGYAGKDKDWIDQFRAHARFVIASLFKGNEQGPQGLLQQSGNHAQ